MEEYKDDKIDTSILDAAMGMKKKQIEDGMDQSPSDVVELELKIREGKGHKGVIYEVDGVKIRIPQLSIIQQKKARREGLKEIASTILGKKIIYAMRSKSDNNEEIDITFEESLELAAATDVEDLWLVVFALRDVHHPRMTFEDDLDLEYCGYLEDFDDLVAAIRKHNGLTEGADEIKFFRDHGSRGSPEKGSPAD